jgi:hypothetical protein
LILALAAGEDTIGENIYLTGENEKKGYSSCVSISGFSFDEEES